MPLKKYKINYGPLKKPNTNRNFVAPMSEAELRTKYGADFEKIWNNPQTIEQMLDIFGEEFFSMYDKDIIERFGEDVNDTYEYLADQPGFEIPTFPELDEVNVSNDNINIDVSNVEDDKEKPEYSVDENGFIHVKDDVDSHIKIEREPVKEEEYDDGDYASNVEFFTKRDLKRDMIVGYRALYNGNPDQTHLPNRFDVVGNRNELSDALEDYRVHNNIPEYRIREAGLNGYAYDPIYAPYQKGRFVDEDAKRLEKGVTALMAVKEEHAKHGFGYMLMHPINYFYEWKAIHNITKTLKEIGFTEAEIEQKENSLTQDNVLSRTNSFVQENEVNNERNLENEHVFEKENLIGVDIVNDKEKSKFIEPKKDDIEIVKDNDINIKIEDKK